MQRIGNEPVVQNIIFPRVCSTLLFLEVKRYAELYRI
uniref:Uncharacterized protein n=1 Tax=virus sp. ctrcb4 TaxID=2825824 RepID=A0A8S5RQB9_9VIRU|nr:MAG TPA: hypothetical protein [virus sp. ctrcb4]